MIWNEWKRSPVVTRAELLAAAFIEPAEVADDRVVWTVDPGDLEALAGRLDKGDLADDWEAEIDPPDGESYEIVLDLQSEENVTIFTWDPKSGDNNAAWPIAWLLAKRLVDAVGARQSTVSVARLLEPVRGIGAGTVTLPLLPLRATAFLPTGTVKPISVGRPASIGALRSAIESHDAWCVLAVQIEPSEEHPAAADLYPVACVAKVVKLAEVSAESIVAFLSGTERVKITGIETTATDVIMAHGVVIEDARPDDRMRPLLLETAKSLLTLSLPQDDLPDDALEVLEQLSSNRLADCAAEIFSPMMLDAIGTEVLQSEAASERSMLVVEALGRLRQTIEDALDQHDGDLGTARMAILNEHAEALERALAGG